MAIKIPKVQTVDRLINQLQSNIISSIESQYSGINGQFEGLLTGCTTVPQKTFYWQRANTSGPVTLSIPDIGATSNTDAATVTGLPSSIWPPITQKLLARVIDNGSAAAGMIVIDTDGSFTLYKDPDGSAFTTSGTKGLAACTVTYMLGFPNS